jgi:hypothetical protein
MRRTDLVDLMSADAVGAIATRSMLMSDYLMQQGEEANLVYFAGINSASLPVF